MVHLQAGVVSRQFIATTVVVRSAVTGPESNWVLRSQDTEPYPVTLY